MAKKNEIDSLKTREQRFKEDRYDKMFVSKRMITSKAFRSLSTAPACQVFMIFLTKCVPKRIDGKPSRKNSWYIANNGDIQFTYKEAWENWSIDSSKFTRAIDELVRVGLIDITKSGFGLKKDLSLYAISDRWGKYGTDEFVVQKREKRKQSLGFAKGNRYGRNSSKK